ncbi:MAG: uroporphyrinogen-III synthase [Methanosarcinaceae archaeon]|nr:uroporphyrinogen-III synthase [Methanosarcinaceae archaeon]
MNNNDTIRPVVAIMRPERYLDGSSKLAESYGFKPVAIPMIELRNMKDDVFDTFMSHVLGGISDYVIFTSANGIDYTIEKVPISQRQAFIDALNNTKVIAIGPTTREQLLELGISVLGMPGVYSSQGLVEYLCSQIDGKVIDIARSAFGSPTLISGLEDCNASVFETKVYTLVRPKGEQQEQLIQKTLAEEISVFAFTSSMMVRSFFEQADSMGEKDEVMNILNRSVVVAIGKPTANTLNEYGIEVNITPQKYTFEEMLRKVRETYYSIQTNNINNEE